MQIVITVQAQPESKDELTNTFASQFDAMRKHLLALAKEDVFGPGDKTTVRFLASTAIVSSSGIPTQEPQKPNIDFPDTQEL